MHFQFWGSNPQPAAFQSLLPVLVLQGKLAARTLHFQPSDMGLQLEVGEGLQEQANLGTLMSLPIPDTLPVLPRASPFGVSLHLHCPLSPFTGTSRGSTPHQRLRSECQEPAQNHPKP